MNTQGAERYVWNEAESVNMSDPGVSVSVTGAELTHAETLELFGGQFLPKTIFGDSYGSYERMYLEQKAHSVLLDESGELPENAYVEYRYLNKAWVEAGSITVYAELCTAERAQEIYYSSAYPHITYSGGAKPSLSSYYLQPFVLAKCDGVRWAQWLAVPDSYFSRAERLEEKAAASGTEAEVPRVALLTFTCRENVSDEQFIAAVRTIGAASAETFTIADPDVTALPADGEKGAA